MEPVTHAVASLALGRAGLGRVTRLAAPMLLVSGLAADLDWISHSVGAPAFLRWHRTATHSLLGTAAISATVAAGFWLWGRRDAEASRRVAYPRALAVCACGAGLHLLLDLTNDAGVKLLWPFQQRWIAWDLAREVDPALLAILLAGLLLPALLNLVERGNRGARAKAARPARRDRCAVACRRLLGPACDGTSARGRSAGFARLSTGGAASRRGVSDGLPASVARRRGDRNSHTRGRRLAHARAPNSTLVPPAASSSRTIRRRCNAPPPARPRGNFWHLRASPWRACSPHRMDSRCGFATCASPQPRSGKPELSPSSI